MIWFERVEGKEKARKKREGVRGVEVVVGRVIVRWAIMRGEVREMMGPIMGGRV